MRIARKRTDRKVIATAALVVETMEERVLFSSIAQVEQGGAATVVTADQNPVITTILTQPGTVANQAGTSRTYNATSGYTFLINDGTGSAEVFNYVPPSGGYVPAVGDTVKVASDYKVFQAIPEFTNITSITKTGTAAVPAPTASSVSALNGTSEPFNVAGYPITLKNVTISGFSGNPATFPTSGSGTITDGSGSMTLFVTGSNTPTFSDVVGAPIPTGPVNVTGYVQIFTSGTTSTPEFVPLSVGAPVIAGVSPSGGAPGGGNTVAINGFGFTGETAVNFGGTPATNVTFVSDNQLTATVPAGAVNTSVDVTVTNPNGTSALTANDKYAYTNNASVFGVSPSSGPLAGGSTVTLTGVNFTGATAVRFGSNAATSFTVNSDSSITATVPAGAAGTVDVTVVGSNGQTSAKSTADQFIYAGAPTVSKITPAGGPDSGSTLVTVTGTNFIGGTPAVTFGGVAATGVKVISPTSLTAFAPYDPGAGAVDVVVTTPSGSSATSASDKYTYAVTTDANAQGLPANSSAILDNGPVVTAILSQPGTTNSATYNNWAFLVNDGTGSIDVYGPAVGGYTPTVGDKLSVTGTWSPYNQIPELTPQTITLISQGNAAPSPTPVTKTISQVALTTLPSTVEGQLVTLNNVTISNSPGSFGGSNFDATITDGTGSMTLFYWPTSYSVANAFFNGLAVPTTPVSLTGIVDVYNGTTPEFIPISEPGTFDRFSMTNDATPTKEADGFSAVQRGTGVTITVTRSESSDNGSVGYALTPDSATAGIDFTGPAGSTTSAGVITGTVSFPAGVTTQTFTVNTAANPADSGDNLFTISLTNPKTDQSGTILPAVTGGPATIVIQDPNASHTLSNNSYNEEGTILKAGPRATSATNINVEANNTTAGANTSFAVLTYNDQSADPTDVFNLPATPVGTVQGVELETVAFPASYDVSGPLNVYVVTNTLVNDNGVYPDSSLKFDTTNDPTEGLGAQLGNKYLLGTIQYNANQAAGVYSPYNLTNLDPTGVAAIRSALNNNAPFTIAVTPGNSTAAASWAGTKTSNLLQSPILRLDYTTATAPTLPAWLSENSAATWDAPSHTLTVTGAATIIADPGTDLPNIVASGSAAQLKVQPATSGVDVHVGGIMLSNGAGITVASVGAGRTHANHNLLVVGAANATSAPAFGIDATSTLDLADNDLIVHDGNYATVQGLATRGRHGSVGGFLDGTWNGTGLTSSSAAAAYKANGQEFTALGVARNGDLPLGQYASWQVGTSNEPLRTDGNDVIVKYTYVGDWALEGMVGDDAATIFTGDYGMAAGATWAQGSYNGGALNDDAATVFTAYFNNGIKNGPRL